jgi:hypothetical protein
MTIVAAVKSRDGLVLGTDSVSQVLGVQPGAAAPQFLKAYTNATKLFRIGDWEIATATWGTGNIGNRSTGGIVLDYAESLTSQPPSIEVAASGLRDFVGPLYDAAFASLAPEARPLLGFLIGGYSTGQSLPELWEVRFPVVPGTSVRTQIVRQPEDFGANWRGIELPFTRLHFGYDPRLIDQLVALGLDRTAAEQALPNFQSPVVFDSMPIQDAIDFAKYILRTTISFTTFEIGIPACGEPLQLAVILRKKGFQWVEEPPYHI